MSGLSGAAASRGTEMARATFTRVATRENLGYQYTEILPLTKGEEVQFWVEMDLDW